MKIAIISASHRQNSRSRQVANWVAESVQQFEMKPTILDLSELDLPFWNDKFWSKESSDFIQWAPTSDLLRECDGVVMISPEWAGMIPPMLTNFLLLCANQELSYKPSLLIGVSAGASGTYPIAQMRMSGSKNNQMIYLPDHIIVRHASADDALERLVPRLNFNLNILRAMACQMIQLRKSIDLKAYPYGL